MQKNTYMTSSPKLVSLKPPAQHIWVSSGAPSPSLTPSLHSPIRPHGLERVLHAPPSLSSSHPISPSLLSSLPFLLPLYLVCVFKTQHKKALTAPWAVTQTVKNVYTLVAFHFCVLILHTHARALTHGVSGASAGCWPREPSQSKGIWALLEKQEKKKER